MSFIGRWWRALNTKYDITDEWPITFVLLILSVTLSIPSLLYYTYAQGENVQFYNYYNMPTWSHWYALTTSAYSNIEIWRFITVHLVWSTAAEIVLGTAALYLIRRTELIITSSTLRTVLLFIVLHVILSIIDILIDYNTNYWMISGIYGWIFFLLPAYVICASPGAIIKIWKIALTDKYALYILCLQLTLVRIPNSCITVAFPLLLGILWQLILWCYEGGLNRVVNPRRPQGRRVGVRGERDDVMPYTPVSATAMAAPGAVSAPAAPAYAPNRGARPSSHYERLAANAKANAIKEDTASMSINTATAAPLPALPRPTQFPLVQTASVVSPSTATRNQARTNEVGRQDDNLVEPTDRHTHREHIKNSEQQTHHIYCKDVMQLSMADLFFFPHFGVALLSYLCLSVLLIFSVEEPFVGRSRVRRGRGRQTQASTSSLNRA